MITRQTVALFQRKKLILNAPQLSAEKVTTVCFSTKGYGHNKCTPHTDLSILSESNCLEFSQLGLIDKVDFDEESRFDKSIKRRHKKLSRKLKKANKWSKSDKRLSMNTGGLNSKRCKLNHDSQSSFSGLFSSFSKPVINQLNSGKLLGFKPGPSEAELGKISALSRHTIAPVLTSAKPANLAHSSNQVSFSQPESSRFPALSTPKNCALEVKNDKK